jgi:23S rRNA (adenine2030-N6)-methyltransferase
MLAYRHAFHAGNHADVLKHLVLTALLRYLGQKEKGFRCIDTHAGAGGYSLSGARAAQRREHALGIARLWGRDDPPALVADYLAQVQVFNGQGPLRRYPGSPAIAAGLLRPQDELRLFELHPSDHRLLARAMRGRAQCRVEPADGFAALPSLLPSPTRRALLLIDPSYEIKTDYTRTLGAAREALTRMPGAVVMIWVPLLQRVDAVRLPQRLRATAEQAAGSAGSKGWLQARLAVARGDDQGFGMLGSSVFVFNPPHTLAASLRASMPWLAGVLAQDGVTPTWAVEGQAA